MPTQSSGSSHLTVPTLVPTRDFPGGPSDHLQPRPLASSAPTPAQIQHLISLQQDYHKYCEALTISCPSQKPMDLAQFAAFQSISASLPPAPAIQPNLELQAELQELRTEIATLKRKRVSPGDDDYDGDEDHAETEHQLEKRRRRRRCGKKQAAKYILGNCTLDSLTPKQLETREELHEMVREQIYQLTGYHKNYFLVRRVGNQRIVPKEPPHLDPPLPQFWRLDFDAPVNRSPNSKIVQRVAELVYQAQQTGAETRKLKHPDVRFTEKDCQDFAKTVIRSIFQAYQTHMHPKNKGKKRLVSHSHNRRKGRQRQIKSNRVALVKDYINAYGEDPTPYLETDWMTEEISDWEHVTADLRTKRCNTALKKAGLSIPEAGVEDKRVVLEVRRPRWRSKKFRQVLANFEPLRADKMRYKCERPSHPRIDLKRPYVHPPPAHLAVYPLMISQHWIDKYAPNYEPDELPPSHDSNPPTYNSEYSTSESEVSDYNYELATPDQSGNEDN
ncbi:hypothetical protein CERSUDRAFT_99746 [Gelatoporia subvermispora B]|uniref:Uncharacterized protein n=1 Tax=Ceriporiopsis subvermispora (strain B) TaxID=914234 RepID=M2R1C3_CERS8|nr:hypothetical protein CERSUDRAFT_99746 [Gelatoporia subvermispora B]